MLGIVYRAISTHLIHKAGLSLRDGATGAVTLIQRFGSALNLNIHFHILFLDGVYVYRGNRPPRFRRVKAPDKGELEELVQLISQRVGRCLERQGLLEKDTESAWLDLDPAEDTDAMPQILGSSVSYRIAVGPQQGPMVWLGCWAYRTARVRIGYMSCMQWRLTDQKSAGRGAAHDEKQHIET